MHDILQNDFSAGWDKMNLHECTSGSFELFTIMRDSTNEMHQESWRAALRLRLKEKLICSKKAADDLKRVHESYINLRPLTNYTATPNGDYDTLYRTTALFRQTTEINQTYTRLTEHLKNYIESINGLLRIFKADDYEIDISYRYTNCTNGFWQASADYDRDLRLYESLSYVSRFSELGIVAVISKITEHLCIQQEDILVQRVIILNITIVCLLCTSLSRQ